MLKAILFYLVCAVLILLAASLIAGRLYSAPGYSGKATDHFDGKKFSNLEKSGPKGFGATIKFLIQRKPGKWTRVEDSSYGEKPAPRVLEGVRVTFVNHSTFLIQSDGLNILTDPIWSERTSPVSWVGPRRMRPPGIPFEDLPKIDLVILSHNHYDHLDLPTLKRISKEHQPRILSPLGVRKFLNSNGIEGALDVDWWDEIRLNDKVRLHPVPAQHFSGRGLFDRNSTLWCGFVMTTSNGNVYFAGDTGYSKKAIQQIVSRYAPVRIALLPIGAYKPEWFMSPIHISPEEAVKIHKELKAETSIAMHFGTFALADDGQDEPIQELEKARKKYGIQPQEFMILKEGSFHEIRQKGIVVSSEAVTFDLEPGLDHRSRF